MIPATWVISVPFHRLRRNQYELPVLSSFRVDAAIHVLYFRRIPICVVAAASARGDPACAMLNKTFRGWPDPAVDGDARRGFLHLLELGVMSPIGNKVSSIAGVCKGCSICSLLFTESGTGEKCGQGIFRVSLSRLERSAAMCGHFLDEP